MQRGASPIGLVVVTAADRATATLRRVGDGVWREQEIMEGVSRKDDGWGDAGGEAASLREAPLPQTPSPEE